MTTTSPHSVYPHHQLDAAAAPSSLEPHDGKAHLDPQSEAVDRGNPSRSPGDQFSREQCSFPGDKGDRQHGDDKPESAELPAARLALPTMLRWMDSGNRVPAKTVGQTRRSPRSFLRSRERILRNDKQPALSYRNLPTDSRTSTSPPIWARSRPGWPGPASLHRLWPVIVI